MKHKIQIAIWSVISTICIVALAIAALFYDRRRVLEAERKMVADELKAKVHRLKIEEAARRAEAEAEVVKVEAEAKKEAERDSVDAANDLITALRSDGSSKGG